jgi:hypothetical protein
MIDSSLTVDILDQLRRLAPEQQRQVLEFARTLAMSPVGVPGKDLLQFAGAIDSGELATMAAAIEEGCERVDVDGG